MMNAPMVRKAPKGSGWRGFWLITGGKRFAAAKKNQELGSIWCHVVVCDDEQAWKMFQRENLDRLHYTPTQAAAARRELTEAADVVRVLIDSRLVGPCMLRMPLRLQGASLVQSKGIIALPGS